VRKLFRNIDRIEVALTNSSSDRLSGKANLPARQLRNNRRTIKQSFRVIDWEHDIKQMDFFQVPLIPRRSPYDALSLRVVSDYSHLINPRVFIADAPR